MDPISFSLANRQGRRIKKFIANPDSNSGVITTPAVIEAGQVIKIPLGRIATLPDITVNGEIVIEGEVFIPAGGTYTTVEIKSDKVSNKDGSFSTNTVDIVSKVRDTDITGIYNMKNGMKVSDQNITPYTGFKNLIVNGNFDIWQRGTTTVSVQNAANIYHVDRFKTTCGMTTGRLDVNKSSLSYNNNSYNSVKITAGVATVTSGDVDRYFGIAHSIEADSCYNLSGKQLTISFLFNTNTPGDFYYNLICNSGVDGSYRYSLVGAFTAVSGSQKITLNIPQLPNGAIIAGTNVGFNVTIGNVPGNNNANTQTALNIWLNEIRPYYTNARNWAGVIGNYIEIAQLQLEVGSVATPFECRPYWLELALCGEPNSTASLGFTPFNQAYQKGFKNLLFNGDFSVDQYNRGNQSNYNNAASPYIDRWWVCQATSVYSGQFIEAPKGFTNMLYVSKVSGQDTIIYQKLEFKKDTAIRIFNNKTYTFSFWAKSNVTNFIEALFFNKSGSSANSYEIKTFTIKSNTVANTWVKVVGTITPDFSYNAGDYIEVRIDPSNSLSGELYITGLQLEEGSIATPFEHRPYALELALCQRYYEKITDFAYITYMTAGNNLWINSRFSVPKRVAPTMNTVSVTYTNAAALSYYDINTGQVNIVCNTTANGQVGFKATIEANAEL